MTRTKFDCVVGKLKVQELKCAGDETMDVAGMTAMNSQGRPAPASAQACPYLASLLSSVRNRCAGQQRCQLTANEFGVSRDQCPGVSAVNFRVNCIKRKGKVNSERGRRICVRAGDARETSYLFQRILSSYNASTPCFYTTLCQLTCRIYDHPTF